MNNSVGSSIQDGPFLRSRTLDLHLNVWSNPAYLRLFVCSVNDSPTRSGKRELCYLYRPSAVEKLLRAVSPGPLTMRS